MKFEKITNVRMPFDLKKKGYGIGGLSIWFILKGEKGAVQYQQYIGVYLPHLKKPNQLTELFDGHDVGYHSIRPMYEEQPSMSCHLFGECYYDGSSLRAGDWNKEILERASKGELMEDIIWSKLEEEYNYRFGEL